MKWSTISMLMVLAGCDLSTSAPPKAAVWVLEGSTVTHLEFGVSRDSGGREPIHVQGLAVTNCVTGDSTAWRTMYDHPVEPIPNRFVYGFSPAGYTADVQPSALSQGCYRVRVLGGRGMTTFDVDSSGAVTQRSMSN